MEKTLTLDVLISTVGNKGLERAKKVIQQPMDDIRYIISCQIPDNDTEINVPDELRDRDDVSVYLINGRGLSKNRNNCLRHSRSDIALIADDDIEYTPTAFKDIIECFMNNPSCEIGLFRYSGADNKTYPEGMINVRKKLPGHHYVSSIEIAIRKCPNTRPLIFDEDFGLGAPIFQSGEESLFIWNAIRSGVNIIMFPFVICNHQDQTTGLAQIDKPGVLRAQGACMAIMYPLTFIPRVILNAYYLKKQGRSFITSMKYMIDGALKVNIIAKRRRPKR
ncbi:MAG: glycosyltransferase [Bacteroidales bacterium]|nr:glycosyltransferase [Bacteroidales bacterium]